MLWLIISHTIKKWKNSSWAFQNDVKNTMFRLYLTYIKVGRKTVKTTIFLKKQNNPKFCGIIWPMWIHPCMYIMGNLLEIYYRYSSCLNMWNLFWVLVVTSMRDCQRLYIFMCELDTTIYRKLYCPPLVKSQFFEEFWLLI